MSLCKNISQKCVRLAAFLSLVAVSAVAAQAQVVFSPPKNISNSSGNTQAQQIAVDKNGNVSLVWVDTSLGNDAIFFSRSSDAGNTFSTPRSISKHAQSTASGPQIALDSAGDINVVWTESSPDGSANFIYFSHSSDGVTFTNPQNISGDAGAATGPRIAVDSSGGVSVVWVDTSVGNSEIFFSHSADGGMTFAAPSNISSDSGDSLAPQIAAGPAGDINIAWQDDTPGIHYDIFFSRSSDGGATFSSPLQVTHSDKFLFVSGISQIAVGANGNIYLLWIQRNSPPASPLFSRSTDGGATFSSPVSVTASTTCFFCSAAISVSMALDPSGTDIGAVAEWLDSDERGGPFALFGHSSDAGASFSTFGSNFGGVLENTSTSNAQIAVDAIGRFNIVDSFSGSQYPFPSNPCLCFEQSADGNEFSGAVVTGYSPTSPLSMALDAGGNAYVAWLQSGNVFFSRGAVPPFSFSVSPTSVVEGGSSTGTLKLVTPAPSGGAVISLSSSNPSAASVPASVTVPAGAASATFAISANPVSSFTFTTITASLTGSTNTVNLDVNPLFGILLGSTTGGNPSSGQISLNQAAPTGGLVISLSSSNPSVASVPASVTVPAGSFFASFSVTTSPVAAATMVQITGTSNGFTHSGTLTVQPARLQQLSVSPTTATGGASSTGTVTLNGPAPAGGAAIALSSSDPSATVPASVTIPAGSTSASFTITTNPGSSTTNVTISASYNGVTLNASLTVQPLILTELNVLQPKVGGGANANWRVCINVPAPAGGAVISMSSSDPSIASVPGGAVTIPQGSPCAFFNINTSQVSANTNVTISASFNGVTLTGTLAVQPIMLQGLQVSGVTGGNTTNGEVILNGPAPAGGVTVSLSDNNPSVASMPAAVTVPAGSQVVQFSVGTTPVSATTVVTVTASYNGVTITNQFPVYPPQ